MRHQNQGRRLNMQDDQRKAMLCNLAVALLEREKIKCGQERAKEVKPLVDQVITLGKRGDLAARRQAIAKLRNKKVVYKLFNDIAPRYSERPGGYTRIVKLGPRQGDGAEMVFLELV
jgi:large subunit ribosomal protein L17